MDLSSNGQELYDLLDNDSHILTKYIQAYDYNQDDDSALRAIGERVGIYIPYMEYSPVYLYDKLKEYILNESDPELTEKIINMTADQYEKYLISLSDTNINLPRDSFYPLYSNRLMELLN